MHILEDFGLSTTCHGIGRISRAKSTSKLLSWIFFYILSVGLCGWVMSERIIKFFAFDVSTKSRVYNEESITFPAIKFCTRNVFRPITSEKYLENLFKEYFNETFSLNKTQYVYRRKIFDSISAITFIQNKALIEYQRLNKTERQKSQLIRKPNFGIFFNDKILKMHEIHETFSLSKGLCFHFNNDKLKNNISLLATTKPGYDNGIHAVIFNPAASGTYSVEPHSGYEIFIHNQSVLPTSNENFFIQNGKMHFIQLKKKITQKYPWPYSDCEEFTSDSFRSSFIYNYIINNNRSYRQKDCFNLCLTKKMIDNCGCVDNYQELAFDADYCNSDLDETCSLKQRNYIDYNMECSDLCPVECETVSYDYFLSNSYFPSDSYFNILKDSIPIEDSNINIQRSFIGFYVYFNELNYELSAESPSSTISSLLSDIGGTLGLFLGMSVLSIIELIELVFNLISFRLKPNKIFLKY